ncbi:MAG: class I SAM-dependent methyltransferase [Oscillospiraceae bacterium]
MSFVVSSAESVPFPDDSFDVVTACQCFFYFDHAAVLPRVAAMLRPGGKLASSIWLAAWRGPDCKGQRGTGAAIQSRGAARAKPGGRLPYRRKPKVVCSRGVFSV